MQVRRANDWAEAVFHVLAHVGGTANLPASVFDPTYVAFAEAHAGPAAERPLAEDAHLLARMFPNHELLARAQLVAWLFADADEALEHAETDTIDLADARVSSLEPIADGVELLRCAALLELPVVRALPAIESDGPTLQRAVATVSCAAPTLSAHELVTVAALRLRGRLVGSEIWVGRHGAALALSADHVAWQAAHEATVGEIAAARQGCEGERAIEHVALVVLAERARRAGLGADHATWFAHFSEAPPPTVSDLPPSLHYLLRSGT